jgi:hypothetical protein
VNPRPYRLRWFGWSDTDDHRPGRRHTACFATREARDAKMSLLREYGLAENFTLDRTDTERAS